MLKAAQDRITFLTDRLQAAEYVHQQDLENLSFLSGEYKHMYERTWCSEAALADCERELRELRNEFDHSRTRCRDISSLVLERNALDCAIRRENIRLGRVDGNNHPLDVDTDEEADDDLRAELGIQKDSRTERALSPDSDYDLFEPYRVAPGIDMWALPGELEPMLAKIIREKHPNDLRKCVARSAVPPPDVTLEITYDDWDTVEPAKVVFSKPVPAQYSLVATRNCNMRTSKVWLDNDDFVQVEPEPSSES